MDVLSKLKVEKFRILKDSELKEIIGRKGVGCPIEEYDLCSTLSCSETYFGGFSYSGYCHYGSFGCICG